jgi:hypothetical protein
MHVEYASDEYAVSQGIQSKKGLSSYSSQYCMYHILLSPVHQLETPSQLHCYHPLINCRLYDNIPIINRQI